MTDITIMLTGIAAIWIIAVVTPGPNFFLTAQTSIMHSRLTALFSVAGTGTGTFLWGMSGYFGIRMLFALAPWIYTTLKVIGGIYLIYLGTQLIISSFRSNSSDAFQPPPAMSRLTAYRMGLLTNLSNPKTAAFVTSLFASTMPESPTLVHGLLCAGLMTGISFLWYGLVAVLFSSVKMAAFFRKGRKWINRVSGAIFIGFGVGLAVRR